MPRTGLEAPTIEELVEGGDMSFQVEGVLQPKDEDSDNTIRYLITIPVRVVRRRAHDSTSSTCLTKFGANLKRILEGMHGVNMEVGRNPYLIKLSVTGGLTRRKVKNTAVRAQVYDMPGDICERIESTIQNRRRR